MNSSILDKVLAVIKSDREGVTNEILQRKLNDIPVQRRVDALNELSRMGQISYIKNNNILVYKYKEPLRNEIAAKLKSGEERVIYEIIEKYGNKGVWSQEIRKKVSLKENQLKRILKSLESNKLIKVVNTVQAINKKVYMLYNLEPDVSITGGVWYEDEKFESEFVEVLTRVCNRFLIEKRSKANTDMTKPPKIIFESSCATVAEVHSHVVATKIATVELTVEHIETILNTTALDGKTEKVKRSDGSFVYRAATMSAIDTLTSQTMCSLCPLFDKCSEHFQIDPLSCLYLNDWLKEF